LKRWLAAQSGRPDAAQLAAEVERGKRLRADFHALVRVTRDRLKTIYASDTSDDEKLAAKGATFATMRTEYDALKATWGGAPAYDRWFAAGANNAGIAAIGLYEDHVPQFAALLAIEGGDLPRFYAEVKTLAKLPKAGRETALAAAMQRVAAGASAPGRHRRRRRKRETVLAAAVQAQGRPG
jgi:predicted aminopeptidase